MKQFVLSIFLLAFGSIIALSAIPGDVNGDSTTDIVDALLIAQYYVGLDPVGFNVEEADVYFDYMVDILDALIVAQYYVGLISELPVVPDPEVTPTPVPTPTPEATPEPSPTISRTVFFGFVKTGSAYSRAITIPNNTLDPIAINSVTLKAGEVNSFGDTTDFVLGYEPGIINDEPHPVTVPVYDVIDIATSDTVSFFIRNDHSLWGCGKNNRGNLGDGTLSEKVYPCEIIGNGVKKVAPGPYHTFILKTDGSLWVCGTDYGQLGFESETEYVLSPHMLFASGVADISTGFANSFVIKTDGSLWGFGNNNNGELGTGDKESRIEPVMVIESGVAGVAAGRSHTLVVKTDGSLWVCGNNRKGQLGIDIGLESVDFIRVFDSGIAKAAAYYHSLALKEDGSLWGCGAAEAIRQTSVPDPPEWVYIAGGSVIDMAAGDDFTLFIRSDGSLWGLGSNSDGQLADEELSKVFPSPVLIYESDVIKVAAGDEHTLVQHSMELDGYSHTAEVPVTILPGGNYSFDVVLAAYIEKDYHAVLSAETDNTEYGTIDFSVTSYSRPDPPEPTPYYEIPTPSPTPCSESGQ